MDSPSPANGAFHPNASPDARTEELIDAAAGAAAGSDRPAVRHDGWTPERIRAFLFAIAECGVVSDAAKAAGMTTKSAYRLRNRADGGAFNLAWIAAQQRARRHISDALFSRAIHGSAEVVVKDGAVVFERYRHDNRLSMALLTRLDHLAQEHDQDSRATRVIAQEFEPFVDLVCAGGEGAAEFLSSRFDLDIVDQDGSRDADVLKRLREYRRGRSAPPDVDFTTLDAGDLAQARYNSLRKSTVEQDEAADAAAVRNLSCSLFEREQGKRRRLSQVAGEP